MITSQATTTMATIQLAEWEWPKAPTFLMLTPASDDAAVATLPAEIQAAVDERKGSVQVPKQLFVVDALPVTGLGKPNKKAVPARFWEGAGRAIG